MHADQAVLAAVHALAQSPLRPGVLDDVTDVAQLRKQVSPVAPSFFPRARIAVAILAAPASPERARSETGSAPASIAPA